MKLRLPALSLALCLTTAPLRADWKDEIGFTRLQSLAGAELPTAPSAGLTQVEASDGSWNYAPNTASSLFSGKTFNIIGSSENSNHANTVATNYYATTSQLPGICNVSIYNAADWMGNSFIKLGAFGAPATENHAVQNHSWIGSSSNDTELNRRLDYAINRDGFVCVVGENNGSANPLPELLGQSYHTISVGRTDGDHTAGFTTHDTSGRIKPDIVAPGTQTSYATPMVAGAAGLLYAQLTTDHPTLSNSDRPRVIKSLLLASATKDTVPAWANTSTRPYDLRYGAGELNIHHAYLTLRAGRASASSSNQHGLCGWSAETLGRNSSKTYFFTLPTGAPSTPFCAALTWHRSISSSTWSSSLANFRLSLHHATGTTLGTEIASSDSSVDNVELVYQSALEPGDYALVVSKGNTSGSTPYALAWHSLPAVTVATTASPAREIDDLEGSIMLTRTGDTTLPLYVPLAIDGTAVPGTHYQALPSSVTIPAGQSSATLPITPIADFLAQGERTVSVSVAADFSFVRDSGQTAVVTIEDKPFDAWRFATFFPAELADPSISSETADPDADQLANLIEYALALTPKSPDVSSTAMADSAGYLALTVSKNPAATDITWAAEVTADLDDWNPAVVVTNDATTFEARDIVLMNAAETRLMRLKITRP